MNTRRITIDQFSPRMATANASAAVVHANVSLSILTLFSLPFLNFIENIGISQTRSALRSIDTAGINQVVPAHPASMLSGVLHT